MVTVPLTDKASFTIDTELNFDDDLDGHRDGYWSRPTLTSGSTQFRAFSLQIEISGSVNNSIEFCITEAAGIGVGLGICVNELLICSQNSSKHILVKNVCNLLPLKK